MEPESSRRRFTGDFDWHGLGARSMSKADEYYARAAQCKTRADETTDPDFRREFKRLAKKWRDLAVQEEIDAVGTASHSAALFGGVKRSRAC